MEVKGRCGYMRVKVVGSFPKDEVRIKTNFPWGRKIGWMEVR